MNNMHEMKNDMRENMDKGKKEAKESVKDWYCYIQEHPLQSMLFGITIFFAVKGLLQD